MVSKLLERISAPVRGLHQAAYLLAALTLASQILALLRDRAFAHSLGAGQVLDLYYAAFRVPDIVFALVASLVSAYVLIPRITGMDRESVCRLLSQSATFLLVIGGGISVIITVWMPEFLAFLYPSFVKSSMSESFILLARMLMIQPILLGLSGVLGSVTQVHRRFALFALSPVLYNIGIIFGTLVLYPRFGLTGIGIGVILGSVAYILVNVPVVIGAGVFPRFQIPQPSVMLPIIRDSIPRSLALGMGSFTALALTALASRIASGSVSVFTFASNLEAVPLALIGSSYAVAAFPSLSEASSPEKKGEFTEILRSSSRHIILWSIVALGLIIVLRAHIVRVILGSGAFDWDATRLTAALLAVLAVGLVAQALTLLFSRALYAVRQSWRPLVYQLCGGAMTIVLVLVFLAMPSDGFPTYLAGILKVRDVEGSTILLVALSAAIGQIGLLIMSLVALINTAPGLVRTLVRPMFEGIIASLSGGVAAYSALYIGGGIAPLTTLVNVFTEGLIAGIVGIATSALALYILGNQEIRVIFRAIAKLIWSGSDSVTLLEPSADEPAQP